MVSKQLTKVINSRVNNINDLIVVGKNVFFVGKEVSITYIRYNSVFIKYLLIRLSLRKESKRLSLFSSTTEVKNVN